MSRKNIKSKDLIWDNTSLDHVTGCWWWTKSADDSGYGHIRINGRLEKAHRVSYEIFNGDVGDKWVLHKCDNPGCVNPEHLFLGTHAENMRDMHSKGRGNPPEVHAQKLTWQEVFLIRQDKRTHQEIANDYHIDRTMVGKIKAGVCWNG